MIDYMNNNTYFGAMVGYTAIVLVIASCVEYYNEYMYEKYEVTYKYSGTDIFFRIYFFYIWIPILICIKLFIELPKFLIRKVADKKGVKVQLKRDYDKAKKDMFPKESLQEVCKNK